MLDDRDYMRSSDSMFNMEDVNRKVRSWSGVKTLIIINICVYFAQSILVENTIFGRNPFFTNAIVLSATHIKNLEIWRIFTYMFAHATIGHIFFNMWGLYIFGGALEDILGKTKFIFLYLFSGLIGAMTWMLFNWASPASVLGASGSVFGIMMAAAMSFPNMKILLLIPPIPMKLKTFVAGYAFIEIFMTLQNASGDHIARLAHLGGLVGGFIFMKNFSKHNSFGNSWEDILTSIISKITRKRFKINKKDIPNEDNFNEKTVDDILDKIGRHGINSLTEHERKILDRARERLKRGN